VLTRADDEVVARTKCKAVEPFYRRVHRERVTGRVGEQLHMLVELGVLVWHTHVLRQGAMRVSSGSAAWTRMHHCPYRLATTELERGSDKGAHGGNACASTRRLRAR
jgi:hypothetical protein